jgi:hypothetical protein
LLDTVLAPGLRERPEHALTPGEPASHLAEAPRRLPKVRRERGVVEQDAEQGVVRAGALDGLREAVSGRRHPADRAGRVRIPQEHAERALAPLHAREECAGPSEHTLEILQHPALVVHERVENPPALLDRPENAIHPLGGRPRLGQGLLRLAGQPGRPRIGQHAVDSSHGLPELPERLSRVRERRPELPIIDESVKGPLPLLDLDRQAPERPDRLGDVGPSRACHDPGECRPQLRRELDQVAEQLCSLLGEACRIERLLGPELASLLEDRRGRAPERDVDDLVPEQPERLDPGHRVRPDAILNPPGDQKLDSHLGAAGLG